VINRRENYLDHDLRCLLRARRKKKKQLLVVDRSFHIRTYQELAVGSARKWIEKPRKGFERAYQNLRNRSELANDLG
jgi:acetylornithine/succinyldiaminopimelate/putrescine aminotransferase